MGLARDGRCRSQAHTHRPAGVLPLSRPLSRNKESSSVPAILIKPDRAHTKKKKTVEGEKSNMIDVDLQLSESHNNTATNGKARRTGTVLWTEHIPQKPYVPYPWQQKNDQCSSRLAGRRTQYRIHSISFLFLRVILYITTEQARQSFQKGSIATPRGG